MICYLSSCEGITPDHLKGFFVGWQHPPTPEEHLRILQTSDVVSLAVETESGLGVGFATAITDGVFSAHIPLVEVVPSCQGQGIGSRLMRHILEQLGDLRMIDLTCDPDVQPFYARLGLTRSTGMMIRSRQATIREARRPQTQSGQRDRTS
jgi:GNAT superfamily N-acetyltransferase